MELIDRKKLKPESLFRKVGLTELEYVEGCSTRQINNAPTVDAVRGVRAECVDVIEERPIFGTMSKCHQSRCSACGGEISAFDAYCKHCGAKTEDWGNE